MNEEFRSKELFDTLPQMTLKCVGAAVPCLAHCEMR